MSRSKNAAMTPFTEITGTAAPLLEKGKPMSNVDTDMIIPKQFLKTTERTGLSKGLFYELKTLADGSPNPDFVLNKPEFSARQTS
jgi:3-isopropylmalate/(R)-2-methylmalate dehydratase small subunit